MTELTEREVLAARLVAFVHDNFGEVVDDRLIERYRAHFGVEAGMWPACGDDYIAVTAGGVVFSLANPAGPVRVCAGPTGSLAVQLS